MLPSASLKQLHSQEQRVDKPFSCPVVKIPLWRRVILTLLRVHVRYEEAAALLARGPCVLVASHKSMLGPV